MKVEKSYLREESSFSLQSFDDASSVLYDNETPEAFDDSGGGDESSTGDDVGSSTAMKNRSYYLLKPSTRQFIGGVRAIEIVGSKCYRTPRGFQKEATFPCRPLVAHTYSPSSFEGGDVPNKMSSAPDTQISTISGKRGVLERFTLMIGKNIPHFKIVKAPVERNCLDGYLPGFSICSLSLLIFPVFPSVFLKILKIKEFSIFTLPIRSSAKITNQSRFLEPRSTSSACRCPLWGKMLQDRSEWKTHE
ncbi:hypothetical protein KIN20_020920 [Parelaphostrongylus tenuis]|uniref:Uncharacterized protein n=1 Tax=Parelaphostrongylus tenuis TaxID=148309 RepID=A0AAD5MN87_PARTN|nr:hypothetical protein KIN20_020920 [Parelaphostrongylus tenuis]